MLRRAQADDKDDLLKLHQAVAAVPGGVIRTIAELTPAYIEGVLERSLNNGLMLVVEDEGQLTGSIHAYTPNLRAFRHLLSDLTIVVHPDFQGRGLGRKLFTTFLEQVRQNSPHILRIELFVRITNTAAIRFYESLGFVQEGAQRDKILNAEGVLETPVAMAWRNPKWEIGDGKSEVEGTR